MKRDAAMLIVDVDHRPLYNITTFQHITTLLDKVIRVIRVFGYEMRHNLDDGSTSASAELMR